LDYGGDWTLACIDGIAIDGPAGAGKSTVAKLVARKLSYLYIDTGAMYRALTWKALNLHMDLEDPDLLGDLVENTDIRLAVDASGQTRVFCDGREITDLIRSPQINKAVSRVALIPAVRKRMVELQRAMAEGGKIVMDGRDIGTHVLPEAANKFFLTASSQERAMRRYRELKEKGHDVTLEEVLAEVKERDWQDSTRSAAPLAKAEGAIEIDTTGLSPDEVANLVIRHVTRGC